MFSLSKLSPSITDMIRFDHSQIMLTFHQYTSSSPPRVKKALAASICDALDMHATLEEDIFYPVMRQLYGTEQVVQKSVPEHNEMRRIIAQLRECKATERRHDALVNELMRDVIHHVADEETVLLPEAERMLGKERLNDMGAQMARRRFEMLKPRARSMARNTAIGFSRSTTMMVLGLASALVAARALSKKRQGAQGGASVHGGVVSLPEPKAL